MNISIRKKYDEMPELSGDQAALLKLIFEYEQRQHIADVGVMVELYNLGLLAIEQKGDQVGNYRYVLTDNGRRFAKALSE